MTSRPAWQDDFPISWTEDHFVTRREFAKSLVRASCASFAASAALTAKTALTRREGPWPTLKVATVGDWPVGHARVFFYPEPDEPCILVRLEADTFVAYGQRCTHLGCPVLYQATERRLHCPCHEGFFSVTDGRVLAGPPPRPLPRIELERRDEELWAVGVRS
jgi:nitrite reductase/ring-hydroxylating ferredoxin subunit